MPEKKNMATPTGDEFLRVQTFFAADNNKTEDNDAQ